MFGALGWVEFLEAHVHGEMGFVVSGVLGMTWGSIWTMDRRDERWSWDSIVQWVLCPDRFPARGHHENAGLEENLTRAGG